jgi:hypothetical protein
MLAFVLLSMLGGDAYAGESRHLEYADKTGVKLTPPPDDKALVVFMRPSKKGGSVHASVYDGEEFITFVQHNTVFPYLTEPGKHRFMVVSEAASFLDADLRGGLIYFVNVRPKMGTWRARFRFNPITRDEKDWEKLSTWLNRARETKPRDTAFVWVENNWPSITNKKEVYEPKWEAKPDEERATIEPDDGVDDFSG